MRQDLTHEKNVCGVFVFFLREMLVFWNSSSPTRKGGLWLPLILTQKSRASSRLFGRGSLICGSFCTCGNPEQKMTYWPDPLGSHSVMLWDQPPLSQCVHTKNLKVIHELHRKKIWGRLLPFWFCPINHQEEQQASAKEELEVKCWIPSIWGGSRWLKRMHSPNQRKPQGEASSGKESYSTHSPTSWSETTIIIMKNERFRLEKVEEKKMVILLLLPEEAPQLIFKPFQFWYYMALDIIIIKTGKYFTRIHYSGYFYYCEFWEEPKACSICIQWQENKCKNIFHKSRLFNVQVENLNYQQNYSHIEEWYSCINTDFF